MRKLTANKKHMVIDQPNLFGFDLSSGASGYPRCPFCKTKEYATLRDLRQHMLWKHWTKLEHLVPPT
ncbi:MAG: hypothetical protein ACLPY5_06985 [Candidatus Bathyarchaeia archaeon]